MPEGLNKIAGCDNPSRLADVVFVHGLDGDATASWHPKGEPHNFWPRWIGEDLPQVGVWTLSYEAHSTAWKGGAMPLSDRATNVLDALDLDLGKLPIPIVFICHSLGGLLVKQLLRHAHDFGTQDHKRLAEQTRSIVFLSTPHFGADMASWLKHLASILRLTDAATDLEAHHPRLRELNLWFRNHAQTPTMQLFVYYEKHPTAGILVVNETTADPGIKGVIPVPLDADHITICKPRNKTTQLHRRVVKTIQEILANPS